jgi:hypothetical protein
MTKIAAMNPPIADANSEDKKLIEPSSEGLF